MNALRHDTEQKNSSGRREGGFRLRRFFRLIALRASSSLVRRIVVLNLAGLVALLVGFLYICLLYTSPSPRDGLLSRMPSSA